MLATLNNAAAQKVLRSGRVARLGCLANGEPYIVPINYNFEDECIYSHSLPGLKITSLRENPRACVQVDEVESDLCWRSVLGFGHYEEVTKANERREVLGNLLEALSHANTS